MTTASPNTFDLHLGDSLEFLKTQPDNSINLVITSPPYADARKSAYGGVKPDEYVEWFLPYTQELQRTLTEDGSFILNIKEKVVDGERHTYVMELVLAMRKQGWRYVDDYIWHKTTGMPGKWNGRFRDLWEHCFHFTKNKGFFMDQDAVKVPVGDWSKTRLKSLSENDKARHKSGTGSGSGRKVDNWVGKDTVYPGNVLHGSPVTHNTGHSAAYPVWLPEFFIKLFCPSDGLVLDPFMGSGTTAVAAHNLERNVIGCELLPIHADICKERVTEKHPSSIIKIIGDGSEVSEE